MISDGSSSLYEGNAFAKFRSKNTKVQVREREREGRGEGGRKKRRERGRDRNAMQKSCMFRVSMIISGES